MSKELLIPIGKQIKVLTGKSENSFRYEYVTIVANELTKKITVVSEGVDFVFKDTIISELEDGEDYYVMGSSINEPQLYQKLSTENGMLTSNKINYHK